MFSDFYPISPSPDFCVYVFRSTGMVGVVVKVVIFQELKQDYYNLAFGDWINGTLHDNVISNNHDVLLVLSTVVQAVRDFTEQRPQAVIEIEPVDARRTALFNVVFRRHSGDLSREFDLFGYIKNNREPYDPARQYERFEVQRKSL